MFDPERYDDDEDSTEESIGEEDSSGSSSEEEDEADPTEAAAEQEIEGDFEYVRLTFARINYPPTWSRKSNNSRNTRERRVVWGCDAIEGLGL